MKLPLTIAIVALTVGTIAAIEIGSIVSEDVLEPSVRNEVDHALERVYDFSACTTKVNHAAIPVAWTNGLSASAQAVKLVSLQNAEGRWIVVTTNDVTKSAAAILKSM